MLITILAQSDAFQLLLLSNLQSKTQRLLMLSLWSSIAKVLRITMHENLKADSTAVFTLLSYSQQSQKASEPALSPFTSQPKAEKLKLFSSKQETQAHLSRVARLPLNANLANPAKILNLCSFAYTELITVKT